jgi:translation initiation factor IF-2
VSEFSANPDRDAKGTVIEATLDRKRGPLATVVVQCGTLRRGDVMLCGDAFGKVRALLDHTGKSLKEAGPSDAVQVRLCFESQGSFKGFRGLGLGLSALKLFS